MKNIVINYDAAIKDGMELVFRTPDDCSGVTGLRVTYNVGLDSKEFDFADAHGKATGHLNDLFGSNAVVKVILDVTNSKAFIQNADTNEYLESRIESTSPGIICEADGKAISIADASDSRLKKLSIYGKTTQQVPTTEIPQDFDDACKGEENITKVLGANLLDTRSLTYNDFGVVGIINEDGSIRLHGTPTKAYARIYTGKIKLPKGKYYISGGKTSDGYAYLLLSGERKDGTAVNVSPGGVFETNGMDMKETFLGIQTSGTTTSINNYTIYPMITYGEIAKPFEPYKLRYKVISNLAENGLRGIPVTTGGNYTDEDGKQWVCDEIDFANGVYIQRIGEYVLDGTETIHGDVGDYGTGQFRYNLNSRHMEAEYEAKPNLYDSMWSHFQYMGINEDSQSCAWIFRIAKNVIGLRLVTTHDSYEKLTTWLKAEKNRGTPVTVRYILNNPISRPLTPDDIDTHMAPHSNKLNTFVMNDGGLHMNVQYISDTKTYIDNKFIELQRAILASGANI